MTILEIRELHTSYSDSVPVLRGVDLKIEQGEFVGVIGLSGSGKSTLLRSINRLIEVNAGAIIAPGSAARRQEQRRHRYSQAFSRRDCAMCGAGSA